MFQSQIFVIFLFRTTLKKLFAWIWRNILNLCKEEIFKFKWQSNVVKIFYVIYRYIKIEKIDYFFKYCNIFIMEYMEIRFF